MARNRKLDFSTYNEQPRVNLRQDIARFLLFARGIAPRVFVSYSEVCQRIHGYPRAPGLKTREVDSVRHTASRVRRFLMEHHECGLITDPALGMRATVDDADVLASQMVKATTTLRGAQDMFTKTSELIDIRKVPNTPENKPLKDWFNASIAPVVKAIATTNFAAKLLPPKRDDANGK